jgi:membrane protease YdiL (CAAX protease family)
MGETQTNAKMPSLRRTVIALVCAPLLLAICVAPLALYVSSTRHVEGDALMRAIEPMTPGPITIGFVLLLLLTTRFAHRDGFTLATLGWTRPSAKDLLIAIAATPVVVLAATKIGYPAIQTVRPSFDPAVPAIAFAPAVVMLVAAVIAEDTLYRGYALQKLCDRLGRPAAIALTSLAYALLAPGQGLALVVFAFVLGVTLCAIRLAAKSIGPVMFVHVATALAPKIEALVAGVS